MNWYGAEEPPPCGSLFGQKSESIRRFGIPTPRYNERLPACGRISAAMASDFGGPVFEVTLSRTFGHRSVIFSGHPPPIGVKLSIIKPPAVTSARESGIAELPTATSGFTCPPATVLN